MNETRSIPHKTLGYEKAVLAVDPTQFDCGSKNGPRHLVHCHAYQILGKGRQGFGELSYRYAESEKTIDNGEFFSLPSNLARRYSMKPRGWG
ncbi:hypothetical protein EVAR_24471_1 [Eumeta japonica]|uniref:Uncharacterized protein n=1 Tax=Eumeta variegata TaxID=151549 RepID=A0A4C1WYY7_EUMVA|nr:hypothetical protein EVAR_24471_1 [Eumeta japonica]